jgi:uncharacterized protein VirK/YbjX
MREAVGSVHSSITRPSPVKADYVAFFAEHGGDSHTHKYMHTHNPMNICIRTLPLSMSTSDRRSPRE